MILVNKTGGSVMLRRYLFNGARNKQTFVIVSRSNDIYANLALEDWLFQQLPSRSQAPWYHLLLWYNKPCIVIGKHQNPWNEVRVGRCNQMNIPIARRKSGGGTVYHDEGNLNLSFLSDPKSHSRKKNNQFVIDVLARKYGITLESNDRDNLVTKDGGFKISGTASKLTPKSTYHHCTLLVSADLNAMHNVIWKGSKLIENKATASVHSSVQNLSELSPSITIDSLIKDFADEFAESSIKLTPNSLATPGIESIDRELREWDWIYGKTPSFTVNSTQDGLSLKINVSRGLIHEIESNPATDLRPLIGCRFVTEDIKKCLTNIVSTDSQTKLALECLLKTLNEIYSIN